LVNYAIEHAKGRLGFTLFKDSKVFLATSRYIMCEEDSRKEDFVPFIQLGLFYELIVCHSLNCSH